MDPSADNTKKSEAGIHASCNVAFITGGRNVPSRRFRIAAMLPYLEKLGFGTREFCPVFERYPPSGRLARPVWFAGAIAERFSLLVRTQRFDAVVLQRELISTLHTFERYLSRPRILDVDDAIFLHRGGTAARKIASACQSVVCGNEYLQDWFAKWNSNTVVIPTGVDTERLRPALGVGNDQNIIIGWIGTASNFKYLEMIQPALRTVLNRYPHVEIQIISNKFPSMLRGIGGKLSFVRWRPDIELESLPKFSIGIMPLRDSEWSRGKCSFKMLQYMAAGVPSVVSPVGMNIALLEKASVGISAKSSADWVGALSSLIEDREVANTMGSLGRDLVVREYSLSVVAALWQQELGKVIA